MRSHQSTSWTSFIIKICMASLVAFILKCIICRPRCDGCIINPARPSPSGRFSGLCSAWRPNLFRCGGTHEYIYMYAHCVFNCELNPTSRRKWCHGFAAVNCFAPVPPHRTFFISHTGLSFLGLGSRGSNQTHGDRDHICVCVCVFPESQRNRDDV